MRLAAASAFLALCLLTAPRAAADLVPDSRGPQRDAIACLTLGEGDLCELDHLDGVCRARTPGAFLLRCDPFAPIAEVHRAEARLAAGRTGRPGRLLLFGSGALLLLGIAISLSAPRGPKQTRARRASWGLLGLASIGGAAGAIALLRASNIAALPAPQGSFTAAEGVTRGPFAPNIYARDIQARPDASPAELAWALPAAPRLVRAGGRDLVVGVFDTRGESGYLGAFDAATLRLLWWLGPFFHPASYRFDVTAEHLVVVDQRGRAHLVDLATGRETARLALADRPDIVRADPSGAPAVWIRLKNGRHAVLDPAQASWQQPPEPPSWAMPSPPASGHCPAAAPPSTCLAGHAVPGVTANYGIRDADAAVAFAWEAPTRLVAQGLDPTALVPRWKAEITASSVGPQDRGGAILLGAQAYVFYETNSAPARFRLAALDVHEGRLLWDIPVDFAVFHGRAIAATTTEVFLAAPPGLTVLSAATGAPLRTLGQQR